MQIAPIPESENKRLASLYRLKILDTLSEANFDRITRLAQTYFNVPVALFTLVDAERQWFKSQQGFNISETPRAFSFCAHTILANEPMVVPDTHLDLRFADNPLVKGEPGIRAYAGQPIHAPDGQCIGSLCVIDYLPRQFTATELADFKYLAELLEQELKNYQPPSEVTPSDLTLTTQLQTLEVGQANDQTMPPLSRALTALAMPLLAHAINALQAGVVITDATKADNPTIYANPGFVNLTGYSLEEILGHNCRFLQKDDREQPALEEIRAAVTTQKAVTAVLRNYKKDGTLFYNELQLTPVFDARGQLTNFIGIQTNVTDRIEAENALRQSETLFRAIVEHGNEMINLIGRNGEVLYQSPSSARVMNYTVEEMAGKNSFDFVHPDDLVDRLEQFKELLAHPGATRHREFRFRHKNGSWRYVETVSQNLLDLPGVNAIVVNGRDVTERKSAELALRRSEEMLNFALEAAQVGIWEYEMGSGQVRWSPQFEPLLGLAAGTFKGSFEAFVELAVPEDRDKLLQNISKAIKTKTSYNIEYRIRRPDGQTHWLEGKGRALYDDKGLPQRLSGIVQDITDRKNTEAALASSQEQLLQAQKMEAVGRLAGGIAHDFNNLLTAITGHCELAMLELSETEPLYEDLDQIKQAANRAAELTRQLLAFSRRQMLQPKDLNINDVVANVEKLLRRLIGEDVELATKPSPELWLVKADPNQLEQVIVNLAVNARDAITSSGRLLIKTHNLTLAEAVVYQHSEIPAGEYVCLTVSDNGSGMDSTTLARIFEPFFTTKEPGRGTGLGLAMVYGIIKQSNGYVTVESTPGAGSTFSIFLPRVLSESHEILPQEVGNLAILPRGNETVLLVEDEEAVRSLVWRVLTRLGYTVVTAQNSHEAMNLSEEELDKVDLIITDIVMPGLDGYQLTQNLQKARPDLAVLYISGYNSVFLANPTNELANLSFLQKPFGALELAYQVRSILDKKLEDNLQAFKLPPFGYTHN